MLFLPPSCYVEPQLFACCFSIFFSVQWERITVAPTEVWRDSFICVGSVRCQAYFWGLKYRHLNWCIQCQPLIGALKDELQKILLQWLTLFVPMADLPIPFKGSPHPFWQQKEAHPAPLKARGLCCSYEWRWVWAQSDGLTPFPACLLLHGHSSKQNWDWQRTHFPLLLGKISACSPPAQAKQACPWEPTAQPLPSALLACRIHCALGARVSSPDCQQWAGPL